MIPRRLVEKFLDEPRDNHVWIKKCTNKELDRAIDALIPRPNIRVPFRKHQKACFLLGVAYKHFFFLLDMGLGKTSLDIELLRYWMKTGDVKRSLVLAPTDEVVGTWEEELDKWAPDMPRLLLTKEYSTPQKLELMQTFKKGLVVMTPAALIRIVSDLVKIKGKRKKRMKPNPAKIDRLGFDALVLDESTKFQNHESVSYRICDRIAGRVDVRYALAGRAFGRDPTPLWAQCHLVDRGDTFGPTLGLFREAFFAKTRSPFGGPYMFDYHFKDKREPDLSRLLQHRSIRYSVDECLDMPRRLPLVRGVAFPRDTLDYYERLQKRMEAARGDRQVVENTFLRMRQLSSGFLGFKDDLTGEKAQFEFDDNPKLDLLMQLLEDMPRRSNAVVFHDFTYSGRRICQELKQRGFDYGWIWGGTKDSRGIRQAFNASDGGYVLVVNNRKGAYGLNLQRANYAFFYESPVSAIDRDQAERRIWRQGQTKTVFQYDLVTRRSMDERILMFHKEGKSLFKALVENPSRVMKMAA